MIYTDDDLAVVRDDLRDAEKRLAWCRVHGASLEETAEAQRWVTAASEMVRRVRSGLGNQNIQEAAKVLGARVVR